MSADRDVKPDNMSPERKPRPHHRPAALRVLDPLQLPTDFEFLPGTPATRADCANVPRPCPYVSCRHHLWLRLQQENAGNPQKGRQGPTTLRAPTMETCSLDVAERGASFERIGKVLGIDPTRARQIATTALLKLRAAGVNVDELLAQL